MSDYVVKQTTTERTQTTGIVMSDSHPPQYKEFPRSTVELAGQSVSDISHGIRAGSPVMMGVIVLNALFFAAAIFFLNLLISGQQNHLGNLLKLQQDQMKEIVVVHNREFDALMEMQTKSNDALAKVHALYTPPPQQPLQVAPAPAPLNLSPPALPRR